MGLTAAATTAYKHKRERKRERSAHKEPKMSVTEERRSFALEPPENLHPPEPRMTRVLAVIDVLIGSYSLVLAWAIPALVVYLIAQHPRPFEDQAGNLIFRAAVLSLLMVGLGGLFFLAAHGLWKVRMRGWWLAVVLHGLLGLSVYDFVLSQISGFRLRFFLPELTLSASGEPVGGGALSFFLNLAVQAGIVGYLLRVRPIFEAHQMRSSPSETPIQT